jgi:hypothetical protein
MWLIVIGGNSTLQGSLFMIVSERDVKYYNLDSNKMPFLELPSFLSALVTHIHGILVHQELLLQSQMPS